MSTLADRWANLLTRRRVKRRPAWLWLLWGYLAERHWCGGRMRILRSQWCLAFGGGGIDVRRICSRCSLNVVLSRSTDFGVLHNGPPEPDFWALYQQSQKGS